MYNLNVNPATAASNAVNNLLAAENACNTPRTPEILNSLIAMSNPLDNYNFGDDAPKTAAPPTSTSSDSNSSSCSQVGSPTNHPPSIQHTCSQLIKAGLKLSIEQKRKNYSDGEDLLDLDKCKRIKKNECSESEEDRVQQNGLTPEDEERRRRRRERNKIAATKCRLKKRERTANLVVESETLETQNIEFKSQIQELEKQRCQLVEMLSIHRVTCQRKIPRVTRDALFTSRLPPVSSVIDSNHSYGRPASVDCYQTQTMETFNRPASTGHNPMFNRSAMQFAKPPSIIIDSPEGYEPQLTNLDDPLLSSEYGFNVQCHEYNLSPTYGNQGMDNGCMA